MKEASRWGCPSSIIRMGRSERCKMLAALNRCGEQTIVEDLDEIGGLKRFVQYSVGMDTVDEVSVPDTRAGAVEHHRDMAHGRIILDRQADVATAHTRQHIIQQGKVGLAFIKQLKGVTAVSTRDDLKTGARENHIHN